jgi:hypothetical protein
MDAHLDSGTSQSLFNGLFLVGLGIEVVNANRKIYSTTDGHTITAYLHDVRLRILEIGDFDLTIGFSEIDIKRNLLGRDFFNLIQIGFREHQMQYFLNVTP